MGRVLFNNDIGYLIKVFRYSLANLVVVLWSSLNPLLIYTPVVLLNFRLDIPHEVEKHFLSTEIYQPQRNPRQFWISVQNQRNLGLVFGFVLYIDTAKMQIDSDMCVLLGGIFKAHKGFGERA
jgi:hypothetical protein